MPVHGPFKGGQIDTFPGSRAQFQPTRRVEDHFKATFPPGRPLRPEIVKPLQSIAPLGRCLQCPGFDFTAGIEPDQLGYPFHI